MTIDRIINSLSLTAQVKQMKYRYQSGFSCGWPTPKNIILREMKQMRYLEDLNTGQIRPFCNKKMIKKFLKNIFQLIYQILFLQKNVDYFTKSSCFSFWRKLQKKASAQIIFLWMRKYWNRRTHLHSFS